MKFLKAMSVLVSVVALPLLFQANYGCGLNVQGTCGPECQERDQATSNTNSYLCSCTCSAGMLQRTIKLSFSDDDAEQKVADSTVDIVSNDLDFSNKQSVGIRFRNVTIPQGATILNATVQFTSSTGGMNPITLQIRGQAADTALPFAATNNNISVRPATTAFVQWNPANWVAGEMGPNQQTPNLSAIVKEIVDRVAWASGNSMVLVFTTASGAGARHAESFDGEAGRAAVLKIDYQDPGAAAIGPQDLPVCMTTALNPNTNGGVQPTNDQLVTDCENRVEQSFTGLAEACGYPANCTCTLGANSQKFAGKCDAPCVENTVEMDCSDFNPVAGTVDATNAPGDTPVCLTNSPLSQALFGRRTRCQVTGTANIEVEDETKTPAASGILQFLGTPCPGGTCAVGLEYRVDIGSITFSNLFGSETFDQLAGLGKSKAGSEAMLSMTGVGNFLQKATEQSSRGHREDEQLALTSLNQDVIGVKVLFGSTTPTCALNGSLVGAVNPELKRCEPHGPNAGDVCDNNDDCEDVDECSNEECDCEQVSTSELNISLALAGSILNQPPTGDTGEDQMHECTDTAGTAVTLDASASSDLDSNISMFSWRRGSRVGPEVGIDAITTVQQPLGSETYFLRVIDAFGQTDEGSTSIDIVDTIEPEVRCGVAKHVLEILNHNLVNVGLLASSQDQCEGTAPITVSVFGDERDQADTGDGVFSPDAKNLGVGTLRLRSERRNAGDGRVYLIVVESTDTSGNRGFDCCTVIVPKSPRLQSSIQAAESQAKTAKNFCLANDGTAPAGYFVIGNGPVIGTKQ